MRKIAFILFLFIAPLNLLSKPNPEVDSLKKIVAKLSILIEENNKKIDSLTQKVNGNQRDINDWENKVKTFEKDESFFSENMAAIIGILALIISIITTRMTIKGASTSEKEKFDRELEQEKMKELQELVAQFIKYASQLNTIITGKLYEAVNNGDDLEALELYESTQSTRDAITSAFYSIKVSLDGSQKQKELENIINTYMHRVITNFSHSRPSDDYTQPIGQLYHKIKAIIHNNYQEP